MEKINRQEIQTENIYFFDKSFIDKEKKCVHVPVKMPKVKGVLDIDIEIFSPFETICKKYPDLDFNSNKWDTLSDDNGVKEYLFYFK